MQDQLALVAQEDLVSEAVCATQARPVVLLWAQLWQVKDSR